MARQRVNKYKDMRKFRKTAINRKKINVSPTVFRGGIRL